MLLADAVAIEVGVGAVALLGAVLAACILGGFALVALITRGAIGTLTTAVTDLTRVVHQNNTLIRIMAARQGAAHDPEE